MGVSVHSAERAAAHYSGSDCPVSAGQRGRLGPDWYYGQPQDGAAGGGAQSDKAVDPGGLSTGEPPGGGSASGAGGGGQAVGRDEPVRCHCGAALAEPGPGAQGSAGQGSAVQGEIAPGAARLGLAAAGAVSHLCNHPVESEGMGEGARPMLGFPAGEPLRHPVLWLWWGPRLVLTWLLLVPIWLYQRAISPFLRPRCRFYPSCSSYAVGAILKHGPLRGTAKGIWRVMRCHPWNPGGYDPP